MPDLQIIPGSCRLQISQHLLIQPKDILCEQPLFCSSVLPTSFCNDSSWFALGNRRGCQLMVLWFLREPKHWGKRELVTGAQGCTWWTGQPCCRHWALPGTPLSFSPALFSCQVSHSDGEHVHPLQYKVCLCHTVLEGFTWCQTLLSHLLGRF